MDTTENAILGTFEGMCADAEITNENGLDITRAVWENVFNSELYQKAIELGHLIGYLGHPDDPNCMDFQQACIVMTEGHIDDDGKVYGKFNLVDTPVGRIVKTFIDSGVTFGISVRGAGDIVNNSVDPETFVFRGFDLVTFPAYKEAIPEFKAIAASTDDEARQKYQKVCAAVQKELGNINSCGAIDVLQEQFPEQSDTYKDLEARKSELLAEGIEEERTLEEEKIDSLTSLYLEEKKRADDAETELNSQIEIFEAQKIKMNKKMHAITRIVAAQERDVDSLNTDYNKELKKLQNKTRTAIAANSKLKEQLHDVKENNLQYRMKIEASEKVIADKDSIISSLQQELDETVVKVTAAQDETSNRDAEIGKLKQQILASQKLVEEYQDAYASLYARAVGVDLRNVSVTASTSVADLQKKITSSSAQYTTSDFYVEPQQDDLDTDIDDDTLVTL